MKLQSALYQKRNSLNLYILLIPSIYDILHKSKFGIKLLNHLIFVPYLNLVNIVDNIKKAFANAKTFIFRSQKWVQNPVLSEQSGLIFYEKP